MGTKSPVGPISRLISTFPVTPPLIGGHGAVLVPDRTHRRHCNTVPRKIFGSWGGSLFPISETPVPRAPPYSTATTAEPIDTVLRILSSEYVARTLPGDDGRMEHTGTLSVLLFSLFLWSCGGDGTQTATTPTPTPVATSITLSVTSLSFTSLGATSQLSATVKDQNGATMSGATLTWAI